MGNSGVRYLMRSITGLSIGGLCAFLLATDAEAQEQSRESMALDNTASQWSFQLAYQANTDYKRDTLANGFIRPEGNKGFFQLRVVAPVPIAGATDCSHFSTSEEMCLSQKTIADSA